MSKKRLALKNSPDGSTRRDVLHYSNSLLLPALFGGAGAAMATGPLKPGRDIYRSIGVEPVINCRGTFTIIGASVELPEVRAAMEAAAQQFVQLDELADAVGRRLAELTGAEWGMVSAGCAAGLKHVTAACVSGGNPEKLLRIPDLAGLDKTEVVAPRSARSVYDHAVRNAGVKMITVDTIEELEAALSPRTAMIYLSAGGSGPLALENVARLAKPRGIPILVDAAAEILTIPNVHLERGATVVAYSGGKAICGPQCAGLLLGRKDILMSAWQASSPHHGPGRDNKVGREETLGMLAAVEAWVKRDHDAEWKKWLSYLDTISTRLSKIDGVRTAVHEPTGLSNKSPMLTVSWDPARLHVSGEEIAEEVARTKPRIALGAGPLWRRRGAEPEPGPPKTSINITAWMMQPGDDRVVADRLFEVLSRKRDPKPAPPAPAANLSGRWDVEVTYFSSKSHHTLTLEQNGNLLQGSHQGDFSVRDVHGTIEGDQVRLQSTDAKPGDVITFTFAGAYAGDGFSGPLYMGEYLNANFTARRRPFPQRRGRIMIPGGPPLAN
ncbi:MAG: aminotransferase class V-fold PLP-dependent enzyme [Bryobacterales bacterium]|nr:aminotransferase class V-fold PLP-dependent enzyme [Bryobacterales bacterium]